MVSNDVTVKTQVDDLIHLLEKEGKITLKDAAKKLNVPLEVLQSWVDFLVEEEIVGIEYKFTTPYLFLNKSESNLENVQVESEEPTLEDFKRNYYKNALKKGIPQEEIEDLWKQHLLDLVELRKQFFYQEAKKKGFDNIDELWEKYLDHLLVNS